ncbi:MULTISPECIES: O-antigen ligase [unclassified Microbacterium]|uniref:O-antigen ligase family protein n=1 Tax=unclassified Microbacterium TaxID=2609290 RepID=UPI000EA95DFC|nr:MULTISPECIES: O-antigen ligase family protein [unclassified Microbacterium]MBT2485006.1 O-antigen ligase family protein [Microbacterium sp. ISL-108]RKN67856.1 O-antigen ligase domain-containing protein [Microbacterium sp. CGR2]
MPKTKTTSSERGGNSVIGPAALAILIWAGSLKETLLFSWVPADLTLLMAALVGLSIINSRVRGGAAGQAVVAPYAIFVALFLPAVLLTQLPTSYANSKIVTLFTITLVLAIAPFYLLRSVRQRQVFLFTLTVLGILAAANLVLAPTVVEGSLGGRLVLEGSNTIAVSRVVFAAVVVLLVGSTIKGQTARRRILMSAGAVALTLIATLTGSRGPVVAAAVALAVVLMTAVAYRKYRVRAILGFVAVAGIGLWYVLQSSQSEGVARIVGSLTGEEGGVPDARVSIWTYALQLIEAKPFGRGWGSFDFAGAPYPHNLLLEIGVEAGLIVLAVVIVLLVATIVRGSRVATDWQTTALFGLFVFALANAMVSADLNGNRLLTVTAFAVWAVTYTKRKEFGDEALLPSSTPRSMSLRSA